MLGQAQGQPVQYHFQAVGELGVAFLGGVGHRRRGGFTVSAIGVLAAASLATLVMRNTKPVAQAATAVEHEQPELVA